MWRKRPDLLVPGRYFFAPEGAPHFPYPHNFGSRNWFGNEDWHNPALGESQDSTQLWFGGGLPEMPPPANVVGSRDCFQRGALYPQGLTLLGTFVGGFPKRCWGPSQPIPILTAGDLNINDRATQLALAQIIELLYGNAATAATALQGILDRPAEISFSSSAGTVYPGIIVARTDAYNVVIVGGVENELQRALSALYSTLPPQNFGNFSTNTYFAQVASHVAAFMFAAGLDATLPTLYVGHSLGGAVSTILAAKTAAANPLSDVRLLTYGTPRPGDDRLRTLIGNLPSANLVNVGDYVAQFPPVLSEFYPLAGEVLPEFGISWVGWKDTANRTAIAIDGRVVAPSALAASWPQIADAIGIVLESAPFPTIEAHTISEYVRRLGLEP